MFEVAMGEVPTGAGLLPAMQFGARSGAGVPLPGAIKDRWEAIYQRNPYYIGIDPVEFLVEQLPKQSPGKVLLPGEGEGRNAVYAARQGWDTHAFDSSSTGRKNALVLVAKSNVSVEYWLADYENFRVPPEIYDAVAIIDLPAQPDVRRRGFDRVREALKPGGILLYEGFAASHKPQLWPTREELQSAFCEFNFRLLLECNVKRKHEGTIHDDMVLRAVAQKPQAL